MFYNRRNLFKLIVGISKNHRRRSNHCKDDSSDIMKFLNVAEKNDAAKTIAGQLSNGTARRVNPDILLLNN